MMGRDSYRDSEGFGREVEVEPRVWSVVGPDNEDHAPGCMFIYKRGILPCSCDATRQQGGKDQHGEYTRWYQRWMRWQEVRSSAVPHPRPIKWPVTGPDGDQWVPGVDFNDDPAS